MSRRSLRLLLGSGAVVLAAAATTGAWASGASADAPAHKASASHWFTQIEPSKDQSVFLRNGSTPTSAGRYQIAVQVTSAHHNMSCFIEKRDGEDLGQSRTIAAGDTAPVVLATGVPAGTPYNLICIGTTQSERVLKGTITETAR